MRTGIGLSTPLRVRVKAENVPGGSIEIDWDPPDAAELDHGTSMQHLPAGSFNEELGLAIHRQTWRGVLPTFQRLWFTEDECKGQAYSDGPNLAATLFGPYPESATGSGRVFPRFFATRTVFEQQVDVVSSLNREGVGVTGCNSDFRATFETAIPADPFTGELPIAIPVAEPIHIGIGP